MRRIMMLFAAIVVLAVPTSAQTVRVDTVDVQIIGNLTSAVITSLDFSPARVGQQFQFQVEARDEHGHVIDPSFLTITWASSDEAVLTINASTGEATTVSEGNVRVSVMVEQPDQYALGFFRYDEGPESIQFTGPNVVGASGVPEGQFCLYLLQQGSLVRRTEDPCPDVFSAPGVGSFEGMERTAETLYSRKQWVLPFAVLKDLASNMRLDQHPRTKVARRAIG